MVIFFGAFLAAANAGLLTTIPVQQTSATPSHYAAAPVQYSSAPVQYSVAPVQYSSAPAHYAAAPAQYLSAPVQYSAAAAHYSIAPLQYSSAPAHYSAAPVQYSSTPVQYSTASARYSAAPGQYSSPVKYSPAPVQYAAAPSFAKVASPVYHAQVPSVAKVAGSEDYDPNPQYNYGYDVQDGLTGDSKSHSEQRQGDAVQGSYSLVDPDGHRRTVDYTADPIHGFNAVVRREPLHAHVAKVAAPAVAAYAAAAPVYHH
ncbi:unnamed protein product [Phaedon cochleariae]|uniref:Uncharacterized protein n=1 Tax=Phaedon cochleariae TaxID=80249 RepID=A0A9P0DKL0_PHACE|nr:unnamed protein product [Phaedon cochleariae]